MNLKLLCIFLLSFSVNSALSQEFDGIKIDGDKSSFVKAMQTKGYSIKSDKGKYIIFSGNAAYSDLTLTAFFSPITKLTWKLVVYLPKQLIWKDLKIQYIQYLDLLIEKNGEPSNNYGFFLTPYTEGDGNEMAALGKDKSNFSASWANPAIRVEITRYGRVSIRYVNLINAVIDEKEEINQR